MRAHAGHRHAEIAGAGFAGLAAATALAQRGWSVRVHERADRLRATGAGIYLYENGLRVLEALGAYAEAVRGAPLAHTRETRDEHDRVLAVHCWGGTSRVFSILRQQVIDALAAAARRAGAEIVTNSQAVAATPAKASSSSPTGERITADLVVAADGANSTLRDSLRPPVEQKIPAGWRDSSPDRQDARKSCVPPKAERRSNIGRAAAASSTRRAARRRSISP